MGLDMLFYIVIAICVMAVLLYAANKMMAIWEVDPKVAQTVMIVLLLIAVFIVIGYVSPVRFFR